MQACALTNFSRSLFAVDCFGLRFDFVEQGGEPLRHRDGGIVQQCAPSASDRSCQREVNCAHRSTRHESWSHHGSFSKVPRTALQGAPTRRTFHERMVPAIVQKAKERPKSLINRWQAQK
jgi:hypothetical protein